MDTQDKSQFEKEWQQAFEDAEAGVSQNVWDKIELGIANSANSKMKNRVLFLQLLAAASVVFALSVIGITSYQWLTDRNSRVQSGGISNNSAPQTTVTTETKDNITTRSTRAQTENTLSQSNENNISDLDSEDATGNPLSKVSADKENNHSAKFPIKNEPGLNRALASKNPNKVNNYNDNTDNHTIKPIIEVNDRRSTAYKDNLAVDNSEANDSNYHDFINKKVVAVNQALEDPLEVSKLFEFLKTDSLLDIELKMVPWYAYVPNKETPEPRDLWAGVDFSAGRFDPNTGNVNNSADLAQMAFEGNELNYKRSPSFSEERVGQSMQVGINVGTKIAQRWVLQSGIGYMQQQTASTSNVVSSSTPSQNTKMVASFNSSDYSSAEKVEEIENIEFTQPYEIVNTYELFTVPLQAGYIILDTKLNITLLTGISNNILIKNKFESESDNLENLTVNAGNESLYRTYQISGLFGSEFSYAIDKRYIVSILPQLRQAINSITKSNTDFDSRPTTLEVGFRFKYILN